MSPLQRIAMGLVVVVGFAYLPGDPSPSWKQYDVLADPLGWLLVISGVHALTRTQQSFAPTRWMAVVAGLVSVPMWFPQVHHRLDASGQWFASLPQILFCLVLAREIGIQAAQQRPPDRYAAHRFGLTVWGFALVGVLPVIALGGGLSRLEAPTQLVSLVVNVVLIYLLFRVHRREWLGGPGPLEVPARPRSGDAGNRREKHDGRPPSS